MTNHIVVLLAALLSAPSVACAQGQSLRAHGAVGDGVTDDTAAVQATVSATCPNGAMYAESGSYRTTGPVHVTCASGLKVSGDGISKTAFVPDNGTTLWSIETSGPVVFRDFACLPNTGNSANCLTMPSDGVSDNRASLFDNLWFANCIVCFDLIHNTGAIFRTVTAATAVSGGAGILFGRSGSAEICCQSQIEAVGGAYGVYGEDVAGLKIVGSTFSGSAEQAIVINVTRSDGGLWFESNDVEGCSRECVVITAAPGISFGTIAFTGGLYQANSGYGVYIWTPSSTLIANVAISGAIMGGTAAGLLIDGVNHFTVGSSIMNGGAIIGPNAKTGSMVGNVCNTSGIQNSGSFVTLANNVGC